MRRWPALGALLAVLWVFIRGPALSARVLTGEVIFGLAVGLPIAFVFRRFYRPEVELVARLAGLPAAAKYFVLFSTEVITANVDVAYRVLAPSMPIEPDVIEVPLRVESDLAVTVIANSITLTPGTLTMDYHEDHHSLVVHAIDGSDPEAILAPIRRWEDLALVIFDEPRDPGAPVPGGETDG
jgi:multicomponent Na+:H+ antiporter subunit E